eukprot:UN01620
MTENESQSKSENVYEFDDTMKIIYSKNFFLSIMNEQQS